MYGNVYNPCCRILSINYHTPLFPCSGDHFAHMDSCPKQDMYLFSSKTPYQVKRKNGYGHFAKISTKDFPFGRLVALQNRSGYHKRSDALIQPIPRLSPTCSTANNNAKPIRHIILPLCLVGANIQSVSTLQHDRQSPPRPCTTKRRSARRPWTSALMRTHRTRLVNLHLELLDHVIPTFPVHRIVAETTWT